MMADRFVEMSADGHQNGAIHRIEGWLNVWGKFDRLGSGSALHIPIKLEGDPLTLRIAF